MATELGQAYVQIMPSAKGISGSIQSALAPEASAAGQSAGSSIGSTLVKAATGIIAAAGIVIAAAAAAAIVIYAGTAGEQTACLVALRREKGVDGEVEAREDLARVLLTADTAVRAVAPRQTYVVSGHEQLDVALEPDDRELTEGYEQLIAIVAEHEIVTAEARAD